MSMARQVATILLGTALASIGVGGLLRAQDSTEPIQWTAELTWPECLHCPNYVRPPLLADGVLYVAAKDGRVRAFDVETGTLLWQFVGESWGGTSAGGYDAVSGDLLFTQTGGAQLLHALDRRTGHERWRFDLGSAYEELGGLAHPVDGVATTGDRVFTVATFSSCCDESGHAEWETKSYVFGLDAQTGQEVWRTAAGGSGPVAAGGLVLSQAANGEIHALDAQDGSRVWTYDIGPDDEVRPQQASIGELTDIDTPDLFVTDDTVYAVGTAGASTEEPAGVLASSPRLFAVDLNTGQHRWTFIPIITPLNVRLPLLTPYIMNVPGPGTRGVEDNALFVTTGSRLHAVDVTTGEERWSLDITTLSEEREAFDLVTTSPVVADGVLYFGGGHADFGGGESYGAVYAVDIAERALRGRYPVEAGGPSRLVVEKGTVVFTVDPAGAPGAEVAPPGLLMAIDRDRAFTPLEPRPVPATVTGRVTATRTGRPVEGAEVALAGALQRGTTTDADGRYVLSDLPPLADDRLVVSKDGYFPARRDGIAVPSGESHDVNLSIEKGATISGRLHDAGGDAVRGAELHLLRVTDDENGTHLDRSARSTNDAEGVFRFGPLEPGEYYLLATPPGVWGFLDGSEPGPTPVRTFFPGTIASSDAQRIEVSTAQDVVGRDFPLLAAETAPVRGTVLRADGTPIDAGIVYLSPTDALAASASVGTYHGRIDREGRFEFAGILPGEYAAWVRAGSSSGRPAEEAFEVVSVPAEGITNLDLRTRTGRGLRGRVTLQGPRSGDVDFTSLQVIAESSLPLLVNPEGRVAEDGSFEIDGNLGPLFGRRHLYVRGLPRDQWLLKSVLVDGRDVTDVPTDFLDEDGEVELTVTSEVGIVAGRVTNWRPGMGGVVIFADHPSPGSGYPGRSRVAILSPDSEGRFHTTVPLVPGDYFAAVVDRLPSHWQSADYLRSLREHTTRFVLEEGRDVTIELDAPPPVQPDR